MKKIMVLSMILFVFLLAACDDPVTRGRQMYKSYFKKTLKDPDSFKVYDEKYIEQDKYTVKWELDYGAKNSLGGMVRKSIEFETFYGSKGLSRLFINGESFSYQELK